MKLRGRTIIVIIITGKLYLQVHFPFPTFSQQVLADALTEALEGGQVKAVGVCNYNVKQLEELHSILDGRGIPLASNQVKFNVLERDALDSGLLQACADRGITLVAHSPLQQGLLTGSILSKLKAKSKFSAFIEGLCERGLLRPSTGISFSGDELVVALLDD